jgi:hypothetical protein
VRVFVCDCGYCTEQKCLYCGERREAPRRPE